ncbi:MAG TPA: putative phage abortive infection protein [Prolixibacteraceae bacterium]|nr:putative phage abortive infection protein [Prolixibacteraceae bacterium]
MKKSSGNVSKWTKVAITMFLIGLAIVVISLIIFLIQYFNWSSKFDSKVASELGSYISGFVGVFWSGAGVILIYATFQEQKKLLINQQFDASFFKLLDTYNNLLNSIRLDNKKDENKRTREKIGKECFSEIWQILRNGSQNKDMWREWVQEGKEKIDIPEIKDLFEKYKESISPGIAILKSFENFVIDEANYLKGGDLSDKFYFAQFDYFLDKYKSELEPYCRFISNIFKYVEEEERDEKTTKKYLKLLWSQMTEEELVILFYYAKNKEIKGDPKLLNWLKNYYFLNDLSNDIFLRYNHKEKFCYKN